MLCRDKNLTYSESYLIYLLNNVLSSPFCICRKVPKISNNKGESALKKVVTEEDSLEATEGV